MDVDPKKLRGWARLLSTLLQTPDGELDDFARERLSKPDLDEAILAKGRELLFYVGRALEEPTEDRWKGLAYALKSLEQWEEGMKPGHDDLGAGATNAAGATNTAGSAPPRAPSPAPAPAPPLSPPAVSPPASPGPSPWSGGHSPYPPAPTPSAPVAPAPPPVVAPAVAAPPAAAPPAPVPASPGPPAALPPGIPRLDTPPVQSRDRAVALPFAGQAQAPPKISGLLGENPALGQTAYRPSGPSGEKGPTMPFKAMPDLRPPTSDPIPLQTYAAFCVERTMWPDNVAGRNQRFGLQPGDEERIDAHFKAKFAQTPKARMEWLQLCAQHKETLQQG